ncbi:hypothetical protein G6F52_013994 [Rhizopus delemar]|nr:hypothetical protein G6F52_013994 [Rhizopus delemar]
MTQAPRKPQVAARFGAAAHRYEAHAPIQRITAARLAGDIARLRLPPRPRILEIGCGTGLLTQALARSGGSRPAARRRAAPRSAAHALLGAREAMAQVRAQIALYAPHDSTVLGTGETVAVVDASWR